MSSQNELLFKLHILWHFTVVASDLQVLLLQPVLATSSFILPFLYFFLPRSVDRSGYIRFRR